MGCLFANMTGRGHNANIVMELRSACIIDRGRDVRTAMELQFASMVNESLDVITVATSVSRAISRSFQEKTPSASTDFQSPNSTPVTRRRVLLQNSTTGLRQALLKLTPDGTRPIQTQIRLRVVPSGLTSYGTYSIEW